MEEAPRVREAIDALLCDVEPDPFRARLEWQLDGRPPTLGALVIRTATAVDPTVSAEAAAGRAAGVQLTYDGLNLTQELVETEPWPPAADDDPDADVVGAEVLVATGLTELAHTGVRERVVEIVRRFGRIHSRDATGDVAAAESGGADATARSDAGAPESDASDTIDSDDAAAPGPEERAEPPLDSDFVVLATAAGADLAAQTVPPGLVEYARDLATGLDVVDPGDALADVDEDVGRIVAAAEPSAEERSRSSMDP